MRMRHLRRRHLPYELPWPTLMRISSQHQPFTLKCYKKLIAPYIRNCRRESDFDSTKPRRHGAEEMRGSSHLVCVKLKISPLKHDDTRLKLRCRNVSRRHFSAYDAWLCRHLLSAARPKARSSAERQERAESSMILHSSRPAGKRCSRKR